jgi:hypothetical protein
VCAPKSGRVKYLKKSFWILKVKSIIKFKSGFSKVKYIVSTHTIFFVYDMDYIPFGNSQENIKQICPNTAWTMVKLDKAHSNSGLK